MGNNFYLTITTLLRVIPTMTYHGEDHIDTSHSLCILSGISSGILPGIFSGICSGISSGTLSGISFGISSDILSRILSGKSSGVLSGKHSGTLSGIIFWQSIWPLRSSSAHWALTVPGWGPAVPTIGSRQLRSSSAHCARTLAKSWQGGSEHGSGCRGGGGEAGGRGGDGRRKRRRRRTTVINSNNPHLAGGEIINKMRIP